MRTIGGHDALAFVIFDAGATLSHPRLDLDGVEPAAGDNQAGRRALLSGFENWRQAKHHPVDISLDIDAGLVFEGTLALAVKRQARLKLLAHLGGHHLMNVSKCHQGRVTRQVLQLVRSAGGGNGAGRESGVVGDEPGSQPGAQYHQRSDREVSGF